MIRFTFTLIVSLAVVVAAALWFSDRPGTVSIEWQGYLIEMSVGGFVLAAALLVAAATILLGLLRAIGRAPGRFREGRRASKRERGYRALTQGMVAVAAGDAEEARRQARKADVLLNEPPLTMLLSAQAAQLNGDEEAAKRYFTAMLDRPETAFLGLRGLLMQADRENDRPAALAYARRAYDLQPKTPWVLNTLFDLQVREGRWRAALETLEEAVKRKAVAADEARDRRAAVLLGCSGEAEAEGDLTEALRYARKANGLAPEYLPGVLRTADLTVRVGKERAAGRLIQNAWGQTPHPDLARLYGEMGETGDALKRVRRFEKLLSFNPGHAESQIALARAALDAGLWGEARNHLKKIVDGGDPEARICRLMAEVEEREFGNTETARNWLLRASSATPDPAWVCGECGAVAETWRPLCAECGALGSLAWEPPPHAHGPAVPLPSGTGHDDAGTEGGKDDSTGAGTPAADAEILPPEKTDGMSAGGDAAPEESPEPPRS